MTPCTTQRRPTQDGSRRDAGRGARRAIPRLRSTRAGRRRKAVPAPPRHPAPGPIRPPPGRDGSCPGVTPPPTMATTAVSAANVSTAGRSRPASRRRASPRWPRCRGRAGQQRECQPDLPPLDDPRHHQRRHRQHGAEHEGRRQGRPQHRTLAVLEEQRQRRTADRRGGPEHTRGGARRHRRRRRHLHRGQDAGDDGHGTPTPHSTVRASAATCATTHAPRRVPASGRPSAAPPPGGRRVGARDAPWPAPAAAPAASGRPARRPARAPPPPGRRGGWPPTRRSPARPPRSPPRPARRRRPRVQVEGVGHLADSVARTGSRGQIAPARSGRAPLGGQGGEAVEDRQHLVARPRAGRTRSR